MSTYRMSIKDESEALNGPVAEPQGDAAFTTPKGEEDQPDERPLGIGPLGLVTNGTIMNSHERRGSMANRKRTG